MPNQDLRRKVTFSARSTAADGYGNPEAGAWAEQFQVFARVRYRLGGETVLADRLSGTQPVSLTVRNTPSTRLIRVEWRAVDTLDPTRVYNIRSIAPDERGRWLDLMCEEGVAV